MERQRKRGLNGRSDAVAAFNGGTCSLARSLARCLGRQPRFIAKTIMLLLFLGLKSVQIRQNPNVENSRKKVVITLYDLNLRFGLGLSDKVIRGALWPEGLTIHSLEDVGAGVAATVHTRRLKAKSCNYSKQSLYLSERGEIGFARHESHSCYMLCKESFGLCQRSPESLR